MTDPTLAATLTAALALALPAVASAQPPGAAAPGATGPDSAAAPAPAWEAHAIGIGLRATSMGLASAADETDAIELGGLGLQARYRISARWETELTLDALSGERADGAYRRDTGVVTLGVLFHLFPDARWDTYLVAGVGAAHDQVVKQSGGGDMQFEFAEGVFEIGAGLARRWDRWSLGAELRAVGMSRNDEEHDGPAFAGMDGPVPVESSGGQLGLFVVHHF